MYIVKWHDHKGNQGAQYFYRLHDALIEAVTLREKFGDPVKVMRIGKPAGI